MSVSTEVTENSVYTHYKGGKYRVLFVAHEATNKRSGQVVVYQANEGGAVYTRDIGEFLELVLCPDGEMRPRFAKHALE